MKEEILVIINPRSGKGRAIKDLQNEFGRHSVEVTFREIGRMRNEELYHDIDNRFTKVFIAGGDGTIHHVINQILHHQVPIGILPFGTGNDYVKNYSKPKCNSEYIDRMLEGSVMESPVGLCNSNSFINGVGVGFDGQIIQNMSLSPSWFTGHAAYYYHVLKILGFYKEKRIKVRIDDETFEDEYLLVLVGLGKYFGGGFKLLPQSKPGQDQLSVCLIRKIAPWRRFVNLPLLESGTHGKIPEVDLITANEVHIESPEALGQIDGEKGGALPYSIRLHELKAKIIVPRAI